MAHNHSHAPVMTNAADIGKAFWISIALNVSYVVVEIVAGIINHSVGLLTDAGHNVSDIASLLLSFIAFKLAARKPDNRFTYGYKKTTILAALANAVILLLAVGVLGYETIRRFVQPEVVKGDVIAWVAGAGIVINTVSALLFAKGSNKDLNIKSTYLHLLADALVSAGVVVAGIVISFTGWYLLDPIIGAVVLIVILISTWKLLTNSFKLSVDAVPEDIDLDNIKSIIEKMRHVAKVHHVHIWAISTTENSLTAHVLLEENLNFEQKMMAIKEIKHELQHCNIHHSTIELDYSIEDCTVDC